MEKHMSRVQKKKHVGIPWMNEWQISALRHNHKPKSKDFWKIGDILHFTDVISLSKIAKEETKEIY